jgi:hypothetical protein
MKWWPFGKSDRDPARPGGGSEELARCLDAFSSYPKACPENELQWVREHREESIPALIRALEEAAAHPKKYGASSRHLFALYLLAELREQAAYPVIVRICRLSGGAAEELLGDIITQDLSRMLVSVCGTDAAPIRSLIEDAGVDEWVRGAAVEALRLLAYDGRMTRGEVVAYYRELLEKRLERKPGVVWGSVISNASDLHPGELLGAIRKSYDEELADDTAVSLDDVERDGRADPEATYEKHKRMSSGPIRDAWADMKWIDGFQSDDEDAGVGDVDLDSFLDDEDEDEDDATPIVREGPKVGRNDPCPCGSGKKFKKCCGV